MLIALQDDQVVRVFDSTSEIAFAIEALDAEDSLRAVFDDAGRRYRIEWLRPNRRGLLTAENGEYTLVPAGTTDLKGLLDAIRGAEFIEPESREREVRDLSAG
jgi:hypothetical protein